MKRSVQKGATTPTPKPPWCCLGILWGGVEFGVWALEDFLAVKGCRVGSAGPPECWKAARSLFSAWLPVAILPPLISFFSERGSI